MHDPVPVLVSGLGGGGHGEQILKALRLAETRYRIIGTDIHSACANRAEVDEFHVVPPAGHPEYLGAILELARHGGARALFHGCEPEMKVFSRHRAEIETHGLYVPVNPPSVIDTCTDKARTTAFLERAGFAVPRSRAVASLADIAGFDLFPAVLKPAVGGGGSANVFIVQSREELEVFARYLLPHCPRLTVQEYVGSPEREFTVGVLFGRDGHLINSIALRRSITSALSVRTRMPNRTGRAELGETLVISSGISQGEIGHWPQVTAQCEQIAQALNPTAPVNIQCRLVGERVVPFEINPRFSGTTSLRAMAGYNEPDVLIRRDVLGQTIKDHFPYAAMTIMRRLEEAVVRSD